MGLPRDQRNVQRIVVPFAPAETSTTQRTSPKSALDSLPYSTRAPDAFVTFAHFSISRRRYTAKSSGFDATATEP